jgi:Na+-translocating ferredoxin:NAD+ oxidoreductase RnfG subunit
MVNMKKFLFVMLAAAMAVSVMASQEDVVKALLPDAGGPAVFKVSADNAAAVQAALGNKMPVRPEYQIYVSKTGVVVIEEQMGKWAVIKLAVLIDPATKTVKKIEIISMNEKRGAGIKQGNFLGQFTGKGAADLIDINTGMRAISGATVSSKAVFIAAKRALVVYGLYAATAGK